MTLAAPSGANVARPAFHLAPVFLEAPDGTDRREPMSSAARAPRRVPVDPAFTQLSTRRLTPQVLEQYRATGRAPEGAWAQGTAADPLATAADATVYTPAQIRAAYGMSTLASANSSVTPAQAAQMGAGQTIYLIDAQDDPNIAAELASFDANFGLPGCTLTPIATSASLPLSAAPSTGCTFSVVYSDANGAMTATAPAYESGWATEIALDVQWAHATAPYARIILIEAVNSGSTSLDSAVQLANQMGPGVVSQSFGAPESSYVSSLDAPYSTANMTYLAAAGDAGAGVDWPAASAHVLAVAGTSLTYSGSGPRTETVWSGTGGGVSAYVPTPAYQGLAVPGLDAPVHRAVSDVTFNADPYTGQYVAIIAQNTTTNPITWEPLTYWVAGGTSLATPQWAGLIAIANALRAQSALAPIGTAQPALYDLGVQATSYANAFLDVTTGSDGSCATCDAGVGYDLPSGLGSPNVAALLSALSGQVQAVSPIVASTTVTGNLKAALSFSITATDANPLTFSLIGAPVGMSVNASTGVVTWPSPVAGTYTVTAIAFDSGSGLTGQGIYVITIAPAEAPTVPSASLAGIVGTALSFCVNATATNPITYSLTAAPSGMTIGSNGCITWSTPTAGTFGVTVTAQDTETGLTGTGVLTLSVIEPGPGIAASGLTGVAGQALSGSIAFTDSAATVLSISISGVPSGLNFVVSGNRLNAAWTSTVTGVYTLQVTVIDTQKLNAAATIPLTIAVN